MKTALSKLTSHSFLLGLALAFGIFVMLVVLHTWFPWLIPILARHRRPLEGALFTASFVAIVVYLRWDLRRRGVFWETLLFFLVMHSAAVVAYSVLVQPILVWQWMIVLYSESYLFFFLLEWSLRHFRSKTVPDQLR